MNKEAGLLPVSGGILAVMGKTFSILAGTHADMGSEMMTHGFRSTEPGMPTYFG